MFSVEQARELLGKAGLFFDADDGDDTEESRQKMAQTLNMNDVWGWACADGKYVPDDKLPELAALFYRYGWAGVLYWVSEQSGGMRSEFHDNNRFIDFVRHEERLKKYRRIASGLTRKYNIFLVRTSLSTEAKKHNEHKRICRRK